MAVACGGDDGLEAPLLLGRRRRRGPSLPPHPGARVPAARLQDAPLHQPLGCADNRRASGGQQDSEQIRIRQYRTGNATQNYFLTGTGRRGRPGRVRCRRPELLGQGQRGERGDGRPRGRCPTTAPPQAPPPPRGGQRSRPGLPPAGRGR